MTPFRRCVREWSAVKVEFFKSFKSESKSSQHSWAGSVNKTTLQWRTALGAHSTMQDTRILRACYCTCCCNDGSLVMDRVSSTLSCMVKCCHARHQNVPPRTRRRRSRCVGFLVDLEQSTVHSMIHCASVYRNLSY